MKGEDKNEAGGQEIKKEFKINELATKAFKNFPTPMALLTEDLRIAWMNERLEDIIGPESRGKKCYRVYQNDLDRCSGCPLSEPLPEGTVREAVCEGSLNGRTIRFVHVALSKNGTPFVLEVWEDVTEKRDAEKELSWLASFPKKNPTPILEWDTDLNLTYRNPAAEKYSSADIAGHPLTPSNLDSILNSMKSGDEESKIKELTYEDKVFSEHIYFLPEESAVRMYAHDITSRKKLEAKYHQSRRDLVLLSRCNQLLVRASSEDELLEDICEAIVQIGGYCLAWVGYAREDEEKSVEPVAQSGFNRGYLDRIDLTWANDDLGQGPTGKAIRTGKPQNTHILSDSDYEPWKEEANQRGYASSIALPLVHEDTAYGALNIYSTDPEAFEKQDEVKLLSDLAKDLTFGIASIREKEKRRSMEKELKDLSDHLLNAREDERTRISRELHDELGQLTSTIIFSLRDYQNQETSECGSGASDKIEEITNMVETLDNKVKDLAVEIRPPSMEEFGLISTLKQELGEIENRHGVQVDLAAAEIDSLTNSNDEVQLYRVIQEAITNAVDHGNPESISVSITRGENSIKVIVEDDGSGFDKGEVESRESHSRLGLIGMRERVRSIAGNLNVESTPDQGTTVKVEIPIEKDDQNGFN